MAAIITQQSAAVPGITQQALDAITDDNVRTVLQQLVSGWQVRNGVSGSGANAFVTRGDLGMSSDDGGGIGAVGFTGASQIASTAFLTPGVITQLVNSIEAQIIASAFFQSLGSAFDAPSGIAKKQTILSNNVGQLSDEVETLGSSVGDLSASLQQESQTRASADGELGAQWTVKTDVNGYVAGFGLATTANNSTPYSAFVVRADEFAIGSPSGPGISPQVPFVVYTTPTTIGGQTVPAGVYMTRAFIANGMIDSAAIALAAITQANIAAAAIGSAQIQNAAVQNAHIGYAAVDSLRLAGRCVTVQASWTGTTGINVNYTSSGGVLLVFYKAFIGAQGNAANGNQPLPGGLSLTLDGQLVESVSNNSGGAMMTSLWVWTPGAGNHNLVVNYSGYVGSQMSLTVFEAMH